MESGIRVLLVEDNPGDARLVELILQHEPGGPYHLEVVDRVAKAVLRLGRPGIDVVLLDRWLPDSHEWQGLREIRSKAPRVPVVVLTGSVGARLPYEAIEKGAQDYHMKGVFPGGVLSRTLSSAIVRHHIEERLAQGRELDAKLMTALGGLAEGIALMEGPTLVFVNPAFTEMTGYKLPELRELPPWMAALVERGKAGKRPALGTGPEIRFRSGDVVLDRKDGSTVDIEYVAKSFGQTGVWRTFLWMRVVALAGSGTPSEDAAPEEALLTAPARSAARRDIPVAPPSQTPSRTVIDPATWVRLREMAGGSKEFLPTLVDHFLSEGRELLDRITKAAGDGDLVAIQEAAHRLSSSSAQVGAVGLRDLCDRLERPGTAAANPGEMEQLVGRAGAEFHEVESALKNLGLDR